MRSRARLGNHPIHPSLVALPVGAFFVALVADLGFLLTERTFWAEMAFVAIAVGIISALGAALAGFVDYTALPRGSKLRATATTHMVLNLAAVGLYAASCYLRWTAEPLTFVPSVLACGLAFLALAVLGGSGWLGGKMVFEMQAGVVEPGESEDRGRRVVSTVSPLRANG